MFSIYHMYSFLIINSLSKMGLCFGPFFFNTYKLRHLLCQSQFFIIKPTEATENDCDVSAWQLGNPTRNFLNSHPIICPCHSQTVMMAAPTLLIEAPKWQWYCDPAVDSLLLSATPHVRLYIFLQHVFTVSVSSSVSTLRLRLVGPHYTRLFSLLHHLSPLIQLLQDVISQKWTFQYPFLFKLLDAVMVHLVTPSLQILWRVGSFLRRLLWGV